MTQKLISELVEVSFRLLFDYLVVFPDEFEEFNVRRGDIPLTIQQNESKDLVLKYLASPFLLLYPPGKKHCLVRIGVFDPNNVSDPITEEDMIEYKDYILIAKKP
jgi:hypothetical protein